MRKSLWRVGWSIVVALGLASPAAFPAADPPALMQYQGVLRNASNAPLTGVDRRIVRAARAVRGDLPSR
jgi:hypothetical protein